MFFRKSDASSHVKVSKCKFPFLIPGLISLILIAPEVLTINFNLKSPCESQPQQDLQAQATQSAHCTIVNGEQNKA
jgi:hypothetical protein